MFETSGGGYNPTDSNEPERETMNLQDIITAARGLSEQDAFALVYALETQHDWVASIWTPGDVLVATDEGIANHYYHDTPEDGLTDGERYAIATNYMWRKGLNESISEYAANHGLIPSITRHSDGTFTVTDILGDTRHSSDGKEL